MGEQLNRSPVPTEQPAELQRSGRTPKPTQAYLEYQRELAANQQAVANIVLNDNECQDDETLYSVTHPLAFAASADPDTMYIDKALKQPDSDKFMAAVQTEIDAREDEDHWDVAPIEEVPEDIPLLPAVWAIQRKKRLMTREVYMESSPECASRSKASTIGRPTLQW